MSFQYKTNKVSKKRVYYEGTDTIYAGYALCYNYDTTTDMNGATIAEGSRCSGRYLRVEKPSAANANFLAGFVAPESNGLAGPGEITVVEPTDGVIVDAWIQANCTNATTLLYVTDGSYALTAAGAAYAGLANETYNSSGAARRLLIRLGATAGAIAKAASIEVLLSDRIVSVETYLSDSIDSVEKYCSDAVVAASNAASAASVAVTATSNALISCETYLSDSIDSVEKLCSDAVAAAVTSVNSVELFLSNQIASDKIVFSDTIVSLETYLSDNTTAVSNSLASEALYIKGRVDSVSLYLSNQIASDKVVFSDTITSIETYLSDSIDSVEKYVSDSIDSVEKFLSDQIYSDAKVWSDTIASDEHYTSDRLDSIENLASDAIAKCNSDEIVLSDNTVAASNAVVLISNKVASEHASIAAQAKTCGTAMVALISDVNYSDIYALASDVQTAMKAISDFLVALSNEYIN
jgi:hypothetical protein